MIAELEKSITANDDEVENRLKLVVGSLLTKLDAKDEEITSLRLSSSMEASRLRTLIDEKMKEAEFLKSRISVAESSIIQDVNFLEGKLRELTLKYDEDKNDWLVKLHSTGDEIIRLRSQISESSSLMPLVGPEELLVAQNEIDSLKKALEEARTQQEQLLLTSGSVVQLRKNFGETEDELLNLRDENKKLTLEIKRLNSHRVKVLVPPVSFTRPPIPESFPVNSLLPNMNQQETLSSGSNSSSSIEDESEETEGKPILERWLDKLVGADETEKFERKLVASLQSRILFLETTNGLLESAIDQAEQELLFWRAAGSSFAISSSSPTDLKILSLVRIALGSALIGKKDLYQRICFGAWKFVTSGKYTHSEAKFLALQEKFKSLKGEYNRLAEAAEKVLPLVKVPSPKFSDERHDLSVEKSPTSSDQEDDLVY